MHQSKLHLWMFLHVGSDPDSLATWHSAYYAMVEQYRRDGRFLGKEQSVMASVCLQETNSIQVLRLVFNMVLEYYSLGGRY